MVLFLECRNSKYCYPSHSIFFLLESSPSFSFSRTLSINLLHILGKPLFDDAKISRLGASWEYCVCQTIITFPAIAGVAMALRWPHGGNSIVNLSSLDSSARAGKARYLHLRGAWNTALDWDRHCQCNHQISIGISVIFYTKHVLQSCCGTWVTSAGDDA